jgi:hypothetical protein
MGDCWNGLSVIDSWFAPLCTGQWIMTILRLSSGLGGLLVKDLKLSASLYGAALTAFDARA